MLRYNQKKSEQNGPDILPDRGEMAERIRGFGWSQTSLGPLSDWPKSLLVTVNHMLLSPAPQFILWGKEGLALYNDAYSVFAGARHPDLLGSKYEEKWPEAADFIRHVIATCLNGGSLTYRQQPFTVYRNKIPEDIWLDILCSPVINDEGKPGGVLVLKNEITEHIKAEKALRENEMRHRLLIESSTGGIWEADLKSGNIFWSDKLIETLGYTPEEISQPGIEFLKSVIHPEDKQKVMERFNQTISTGKPYDSEYRVRQKNGQYIYVLSKGRATLDENGQVSKISGLVFDITERKEAEASLRESELRFSSIFNQSSVGIAQADLDGKFVLVNDRYCDIVERSKEDLYHITLFHITHPDDLKPNLPLLERSIIEGIPFILEKRYVRPDGSSVWVNMNVSTVRDSEGRPLYILGVCQDISERKQAEEAIKESEQRFRSIADEAPAFIFMGGEEANVEYFNKTWLDFTGMSFEEGLARGWKLVTHSDDWKTVDDIYTGAYNARKPYSMEIRQKDKDGLYQWVLWKGIPRLLPDGRFVGMMGIGIVITERKEAEQALKESEQRFRALADNISQLAWMADEKGSIFWYNKRWYDFTGAKLEESAGWGWQKFHHPDHIERVVEKVKHHFATGYEWEDLFPLRSKEGNYRWFLSRSVPIRDEEGMVTRWFGTATDITEQKKLNEALQESESRFKNMADSSPSLIWVMDELGRMTYVNKTFQQYVGISVNTDELVNWEPFVPEEDVESMRKILAKAYLTRQPFRLEHRIRYKDAFWRWLIASANPRFTEGEFKGFIGSNIDITDRKEAEKALELKNAQLIRINNDLDNFIYTASHDLKAPINNIEGLMDALKQSYEEVCPENEDIQGLTRMIDESISRFKNTIKDLAEVAKAENAGEEDYDEVPFKEMLEEVKANIKHEITLSKAKIVDDFSQVQSIYFSRKNLRSILYNLISNSIKYRVPDRPLVVQVNSSRPDKKHVLLTVQDNGLGLREEDKPKVFKMFKRLHHHVEGTGIGLSIVRKIVDNNGGRIEIDSEADKGTAFKVFFKV